MDARRSASRFFTTHAKQYDPLHTTCYLLASPAARNIGAADTPQYINRLEVATDPEDPTDHHLYGGILDCGGCFIASSTGRNATS
jgi:hypothetical protein